MFDIGFSELMVIGVVALIVIGPERLPKVARTVGAWVGRLNRYVSEVKGDIDREMRMDELRKLQEEMKTSAQKYEIMAKETGQKIEREVDEVDKVIKAMAATDGGLSQREYEKSKAEAALAGTPEVSKSSDATHQALESALGADLNEENKADAHVMGVSTEQRRPT